MYEPRFYRFWSTDKDLVSFNVVIKETDLYIRASCDLTEKAREIVVKQRGLLEDYIERDPGFAASLAPYPVGDEAPEIVRQMAGAAVSTGVGPMAAVAGAIAEYVGRGLLEYTPEVIVENGGDIFLKCQRIRLVGIYAGKTSFAGRLALEVRPEETPLGICTSSGTIGHSLSFGKADAVIVTSSSTALADAAATAVANLINDESDIPTGLEFAQGTEGLRGVAIIKNDKLALWGQIKVVPVQEKA